MNGQVSWSELFFSANGRASRLPSLIGAGVLLTLAAFYACLSVAVAWILRRLARVPMAAVGAPERALGEG